MKKALFLILLIITSFNCFAQFSIGNISVKYVDKSRKDRIVTAEIYYPSLKNGKNTPLATGSFPVIIFGHGYLLGYGSYSYFHKAIVPLGYIVIFPTTEGDASPDHQLFGDDMAFLLNAIQTEGNNNTSVFYNKIAKSSAIMGHSMGGGAAFLACKNNLTPSCMVSLAAANTIPSSITAAKDVTIPALVISAEKDCVAPPENNQKPMYDSLASPCKIYLNINKGGHCYFADYNFLCSLGETACSIPLSRDKQQFTTLDFVALYFDFYLNKNEAAWKTLNDSISTSTRVSYKKSCTTTNSKIVHKFLADLTVFPNPSKNKVNITFSLNEKNILSIEMYSMSGVSMYSKSESFNRGNNSVSINTSGFPKGLYSILIKGKTFSHIQKLIIE